MFGDILKRCRRRFSRINRCDSIRQLRSNAPLFEPIHGSAPLASGDGHSQSIGSILSVAMMLRDAFGLALEADWVEQSLLRVLSGGYRTPDISEMADARLPALPSRKCSAKRCSVPWSTPSATAGVSDRPLLQSSPHRLAAQHLAVSRRPCENPPRMLLFSLPR